MRAWIRKVWAKRPWRKRRSGDSSETPPLREFIYLDEVSVYSLLASSRGAVPSEQTDSETAEVRQTVDSEVGANAPVAKAAVRSQFQTTSTQGTQVIRKSIIQSTFKELVDLEQDRMRFRDGDGVEAEGAPSLDSIEDLLDLDDDNHVVRCDSLMRGDLFELEVELTPEDVFTASQIVKSMFAFFKEMPSLFSLDAETLEQGRMIDTVFDRLLVGLVPIRARASRYRRLVLEGHELLVSVSLLGKNPMIQEHNPEPFYVVGVAERDLFWRDLRRVLFSDSQFFVMGRLSGAGLSSSWSPIKMANVFEGQVPQIARELDRLPSSFLDSMREGFTASQSGGSGPQPSLALTFAERLAEKVGDKWTAEDSTEVGIEVFSSDPSGTIEERRALTGPIIAQLEGRLGKELDRTVVATLRDDVFDSSGDGHLVTGDDSASERVAKTPDHLLETEIVAIYW